MPTIIFVAHCKLKVESQIMEIEAGRNVTSVLTNEDVPVHAMKSHGGFGV